MAIEVGEIVAILKADVSQFINGFTEAGKRADGFAKGLEGSRAKVNEVGLGLVSMGGKLTAASAAIGALGVAAAKEFGSFAEEIEIISKKTGISEESLQKWNFALNRAGLEVGSLLPGLKKLSTVVTSAFAGDDKAVAKIEHLGVSLDELKGKNSEQIFLTLAGAIAKIEDPLARNAALSATFGKAGMSLVPVLGDLADGFAASGKQAEQLGLVFNKDAMASAQALDDSFDDLTATMAGFSRTIATTFSGPLKDTIIVLTETLGAFNRWWQGIDDGTKKVVMIMTAAFAASGPIIATIGAFMVVVSAGLAPLMIGGAIVVGLIGAVTALIVNWESLKAKGIALWTGLKNGVVQIVTDMYDGIKKYLSDKLMAVVAPVQNFANSVLDIFKKLRHEVVGGSEVPDMVEEIGDHMRMLDKNMTAPARVAAQGTWQVFRELAGNMESTTRQIATTSMSAWTSASSMISNALANQIMQGNDWKQTMTSMGTSVLAAFINLGIQLIAQKALQLAAWTAINTGIIAGEAATATTTTGIWAGAAAAITGTFGAMTGAIMGFFTATIIPFFAAIGTALMTFLSSIAAAASATIFGIPYALAILAGVAVIGAAIGSLMAFAFADGGVVTKPVMGLVGEAGPEAIIPLSKLDQFMGGGGASTVVIELDGRILSKSVFDNMSSVTRMRMGRA